MRTAVKLHHPNIILGNPIHFRYFHICDIIFTLIIDICVNIIKVVKTYTHVMRKLRPK